jgi:hypothetical protein
MRRVRNMGMTKRCGDDYDDDDGDDDDNGVMAMAFLSITPINNFIHLVNVFIIMHSD